MIRFILKNTYKDPSNESVTDRFITLDADVPNVEQELKGGDCGEVGYDITTLIGIELIIKESESK